MAPNEGRVMLVTGAAGGVGLAICRELARSGATVIAADLNRELGEAGVKVLTAAGLSVEFAPLDVSEEASWLGAVKEIERRHGRLDALVNCAGTVVVKSLEETSLA